MYMYMYMYIYMYMCIYMYMYGALLSILHATLSVSERFVSLVYQWKHICFFINLLT